MKKIFNAIFSKIESNIPYSLFFFITLSFILVMGIAFFIAYLGQKYNF